MKKILDVCCGSRMFWFDKNNSAVVFNDFRKEETTLCDGRTLKINPDTQYDFRKLGFKDKTFKLVVFDPPHFLKLGKNSWMAKKYGVLNKSWQQDIQEGFKECFRVLEDDGILVFKWSAVDISLSEIISLSDIKPLFGHTTRQKNQCTWFVFMKGIKATP